PQPAEQPAPGVVLIAVEEYTFDVVGVDEQVAHQRPDPDPADIAMLAGDCGVGRKRVAPEVGDEPVGQRNILSRPRGRLSRHACKLPVSAAVRLIPAPAYAVGFRGSGPSDWQLTRTPGARAIRRNSRQGTGGKKPDKMQRG